MSFLMQHYEITVLAFLLLFALSFSLECSDTENYLKVTKKSKRYAGEESFVIRSGSTTVLQSPEFESDTTQTFEYCVPKNTNNQYSMQLEDSYGDSWYAGAWLELRGIYDNIFFKNMMVHTNHEDYALSLYYPILKNASWKMTSSATGTWTQYTYDDSAWNTVTLGTEMTPVAGTQYFRKTFSGIAAMAAHETRFYYKCGIVAYLNGVQIFSDNMRDAITPTTPAAGCYSTTAYRAIVRPGSEIESAQSVLAVELHFQDETAPVDFNAFMAALAPSIPGSTCYAIADGVTVTASVTTIDRMFDWDKVTSSVAPASTTDPFTVYFSFNNTMPYLSGLRIWPSTSTYNAPHTLTWSGKSTGSEYSTVISASNIAFVEGENKFLYGYFNSNLFKDYRLQVLQGYAASVALYEVHPLVCSIGVPTSIDFSPASYSFNAIYDSVSIAPVVSEFTGCSIQPALPQGLTLDETTCTVTGSYASALPATTFTMSSVRGEQTFTGTFSLEFVACNDKMVMLRRVYGYNAGREFYSIENASGETVYSIQPLTTQENDKEFKTFICLPEGEYTVTMGGLNTYWEDNSYLYVYAMIDADEYEMLTRTRYDSLEALEAGYFSTTYPVSFRSQWFYKMNEVPANWFGSETAGWAESTMGSFPDATNTIQLYKKTFTVASLEKYAGFVISLRYKFGCVIYVNNREVFRNGVVGDLSTSSVAENIYDSVKYRTISLPVKTYMEGMTPGVNYIVQGANTIAIALVSTTSTKTSFFDCAVRFMGVTSESRVLGAFTVTGEGMCQGQYDDLFKDYYFYFYYCMMCEPNSFEITFDNDRREWIGAVAVQLNYMQQDSQPVRFNLKARNSNQEQWTTLKEVTGLTWSLMGQRKMIYIQQNKPWNQYRFENFAGASETCSWGLNRLDLFSVSLDMDIPDLQYLPAGQNLEIYKDIEMAELYSNSELIYNYSVSPALPEGLAIDVNTGMISGTVHSTAGSGNSYTVTATKMNGDSTSAVITITISVCHGGKSLITLVARLDDWPQEGSYKLYQGKTATGEPVAAVDAFSVAGGLNYADWCLPHDLYNLNLFDSTQDGWVNPAGWYLTVDVGDIRFETGQVVGAGPITALFSSLLPFQIDYDDWTFLKDAQAPEHWNAVDFTPADWTTDKAANIGVNSRVTTYIRYEFSIPNIDDYAVLNVRVKYAGGLVAYMNTRRVARFNLEEGFTDATESTTPVTEAVASKFHVILNTAGAAAGKNVMAFEVHRPRGESSSVPVVFDATGVFGVSECSVLLDSYASIQSNIPDASTLSDLFDLSPATYKEISSPVGTYVAWVVENLEGSRFNAYAWQTGFAVTSLGFSVYGRSASEEDYMTMLELTEQAVADRQRKTWSIEPGIVGFREYKFEIDIAPSALTLSDNFFVYCKATGAVCPGIEEYPPVSEGQISPAKCGYGFRGYSYRECHDGVLGDVKTDKCEYKDPMNLSYEASNMVFVMGVEGTSGRPVYENLITEFFLEEGVTLPEGLSLDPITGEIAGIPTALSDSKAYTIHGKNARSATFVEIAISVQKGYCAPDGVFDRTNAGETVVVNCWNQQRFSVGVKWRSCVLGKKNGEWQRPMGICVSPVVLSLVLVVVVPALLLLSVSCKRIVEKTKHSQVRRQKPSYRGYQSFVPDDSVAIEM